MSEPNRPYGPRPLPRWLLATIAAGICAIGGGFWASSHSQQIEVLNGLDVEVAVQIGGSRTTVKPGERLSMRVSTGPTVIVTTAGVMEVERLLVNVPSSERVVYNVAGAGFFYRETVTYTGGAPVPPEYVFYCGQTLIELGPIDFWFTDAPRSISTKQATERRSRVVWANEAWPCARWLFQKGEFASVAPMSLLRANLHPNDVGIVGEAATVLVAADRERTALGLIDRLVAAHPADVDAQVFQQRILGLTNHLDRLPTRVPTADAPDQAYVFARVQEPQQRIEYLDGIVKQNPGPVLPRLGLAFALVDSDPARAIGMFEKLLTEELGSRRRTAVLDYLACLAATGRISDAWDFLARAPFPKDATAEELAILSGIASLANKPEPTLQLFEPRERALSEVLRGRTPAVADANPLTAPQLALAASARKKAPQEILGQFSGPGFVPSTIPSPWLWAMICELDRTAPVWRARLEPGLGAERQLIPRVLAFVHTGTPFANMDRLLNGPERSAVWLARVRWLQTHPEKNAKGYDLALAKAHAEVTRLDVFRLWGAALRETWDPPQPPVVQSMRRDINRWTVIE